MIVGDKVKLKKTHHMMNKKLQEYLESQGTVIAVGLGSFSSKVLVDFEKQDYNYGRWWVDVRYLELIK